MPEIRVKRAAKKDLTRIGPGPERTRIVAGLRRLAEDAPNLDITTITGAAPAGSGYASASIESAITESE